MFKLNDFLEVWLFDTSEVFLFIFSSSSGCFSCPCEVSEAPIGPLGPRHRSSLHSPCPDAVLWCQLVQAALLHVFACCEQKLNPVLSHRPWLMHPLLWCSRAEGSWCAAVWLCAGPCLASAVLYHLACCRRGWFKYSLMSSVSNTWWFCS